MGRTASTEPQCLYKGALYLFFYLTKGILIERWVSFGYIFLYTINVSSLVSPRTMGFSEWVFEFLAWIFHR